MARAHLVGLVLQTDLLPGIEQRAFIDIDSLLRPVFGHAKQGASYGHTTVEDPDTGQLISDAEVAEVEFTAFAGTNSPVIGRLIVRRVRDRATTNELVPVWRHHPFFTNSVEPTPAADITHRRPRSSRPCTRT